MAFKVIIIVIELMFLGINMFLALVRAHFNARHVRVKIILSRAKNIFTPANVNSIVILHIETFFGQDFNNNLAEFGIQTRICFKGICYSKYFTKNCNPPPVYTLVQTV